jgi:hypothetical protein
MNYIISNSLICGILSTVVGGIILAFLFFLFREYIFPLPKLSDTWYVRTKTEKTSYGKYLDLQLDFIVMLWVEGNIIHGTCEKIAEKSTEDEKEYTGKNRKSGVINGSINKQYLKRDNITLHVVIDDFGRKSTYLFKIKKDFNFFRCSNVIFTGTFSSMVANQKGITTWSRDKF